MTGHAEALQATLWVPGPLPGMNDLIAAAKGAGGTGRGYAKLKKQWTQDVWAWAKEARLPSFPRRVILSFHWFERERRRDPDNVAAGGRKLILDGLVAAGVLRGDGWRYIQSWSDRFDVRLDRCGAAVTLIHYAGSVQM